jgi:hypothetical protein
MKFFEGEQSIAQLEKIKGGYYYLKIEAAIINQFEKKRHTRLICHLDKKISFRCGLNHLGDGNFFIIVSGKNVELLKKKLGDPIHYKIEEDPDQLGVEIPEVLTVFLEQDEALKMIYNTITDGKKRSLIYSILKTKNIDKQIIEISTFLNKEYISINKKKNK